MRLLAILMVMSVSDNSVNHQNGAIAPLCNYTSITLNAKRKRCSALLVSDINGLVTLLFFVIRLLCRASYCFGILSKGGAKFYLSLVVLGCFCIVAFLLGPGASPG